MSIGAGDIVGLANAYSTRMGALKPTDGAYYVVKTSGVLGNINSHELAPVGLSGYVMCGTTSFPDARINYPRGGKLDLPTVAHSGLVLTAHSSVNGRYVAMCTNSNVVVYDLVTHTVNWSGNLAEAHTSDSSVAVSEDGAQICIGGVGKKNEFVDASGQVAISAAVMDAFGMEFNPQTSRFVTLAGAIKEYDGTTWVTMSAVSGSRVHSLKRSPDGLTFCATSNNPFWYAVNGSDYSSITIPPLVGYGWLAIWKNNDEVYIVREPYYGVQVQVSKRDASGDFGAWVANEDHQFNHNGSCFTVYGGNYKIPITLTDTAEEDEFVARAYNDEGVEIGQSPVFTASVDLLVPTSDPCMVIVTGIHMKFHQPDKSYGLGQLIYTGDSIYSYECTTAGTTDSTKPAYPTSGTITDGSAVFTTRSKLCKPIGNFPINPVPV